MPRASAQTLLATDIPGVFRNRAGVHCNERGVRLDFAELKKADDARWAEGPLGTTPKTPAELLKGVALDPRFPMDTRMQAARQAAPYYDMRMPLRIDAGPAATSGIDLAKLSAMPRKKREELLALLRDAGVQL